MIKKTLDPHWKPFEVSIATLNNGDMERTLLWEVFDWNASGKEDFIGCKKPTFMLYSIIFFDCFLEAFKASVTEIEQKNRWTLINSKKSKNKQASGELVFEMVQVEKAYSFLEYIQGGVEINLMIGIDFTGLKKFFYIIFGEAYKSLFFEQFQWRP